MTGHVFISHGSEDREDAEKISAFVEARGVRTWIAPRDVRPGMDYSEELQRAIETCLAFVVLVSETSNKSPYVRAETEMAFSTSKPIFPVRRSNIKPAAGLAFFLKIRHWTDAYGPGGDAAMERLGRELEVLGGVEAPPPPEAQAQTVPPPPTPPPPPPPPADEARLRAAIGDNADYFLRKWAEMDAKKSQISWNWAACLLSIYWFAYRKMWLWLAVTGVAFAVLSLVGAADARLGQATFLATIAITFATGAFGNQLYRSQTKALAANPALDAAALAARGGTSKGGVFAAIGGTLLVSMASGALLVKSAPLRPVPPPTDQRPQPQPDPPAPDQVVLDRQFLVGRWSDDGNCDSVTEFRSDGTIIANNGGVGTWTLSGDQITVVGTTGTLTFTAAAVNQNVLQLVNANGTTGRSIRC